MKKPMAGTLLILLTFLFLNGCKGRDLSRSTAAAAIAATGSLPAAEYRQLRSEFGKMDSDGSLFIYNWPYDGLPVSADIAHFIGTGLLTTVPTGSRGNIFSNVRLVPSVATRADQARVARNGLQIKICDQVLGDVTGIQTNEQEGTAIVEYAVKRTNWTPFGEYYRQMNSQEYPESSTRQATFKRYDDGWRLLK